MAQMPTSARIHQVEFVDWLTDHGVDMTKIDIRAVRTSDSADLEYGVFAACNLPAGATCVTIPLTIALTEDVVLNSRTAMDAKRLGMTPSIRTLTFVEMLLQRADPLSHFGPYLRALPVRHTDPVSWPEEGLRLLRGSNLLSATRRILADLRASFDAFIPALCKADPTRYPSSVLHYSAFLWAHSSFVSRAFPLTPDADGQLRLSAGTSMEVTVGSESTLPKATVDSAKKRQQCLLPLLDALNHRYSAPIVWESGGGAFSSGGRPTVGFAIGRPLIKGQEIFNNYGPKSNEELLLTYGFVLQNNPQDAYHLEVASMAADDGEELRAKQTLLAAMKLPRRHALRTPTHPSKKRDRRSRDISEGESGASLRGCLPVGLLRLIRLALLNRAELLALNGRNEPAEVVLATPVSGHNEMVALRQLLSLLRGKLLQLDGRVGETDLAASANADSAMGSAKPRPGSSTLPRVWKSLAGVYLKQQWGILQHGIAECKSRLYAVATVSTRLRSSRDWRVWNYSLQQRHRRSVSGTTVRVTELPLSQPPQAARKEAKCCTQAIALSRGIVYATTNISTGGACLSIPSSELITANAALAAGEWGESLSAVAGIDEDAILMLFLIHKKQEFASTDCHDKTSSLWLKFLQHPSLQNCSSSSAPCSWNAAERALLDGTEAGVLIEEAVIGLTDLHEAMFPALADAYPQAFPADVYTLDAMRWAAVVLARHSVELQVAATTTSQGVTAVIPLLDAAPRHQIDGTCFHDFDSATSSYVLRTLRKLRCTEEVAVCAGRGGDRSRLLAETGARQATRATGSRDEGGVLLTVTDTSGRESIDEHTKKVRVSVAEADDGGGLLLWPPNMQAAIQKEDRSALRRQLYTALVSQTRTVIQLLQQAKSAVVQCERNSQTKHCASTDSSSSLVICPDVARCCSAHLAADLAVLKSSTVALTKIIGQFS